MKIPNISAVMITCDSARTIDQCLQALAVFEEVVVCDTGSSDDTIECAGRYSNVRLFQIEFNGFGDAKREAVSKASNDWIFSIDSDEIADSALLDAVASWDTNGNCNRLGVIDRRNFFMGKHIKRGGLGRDHIPRLFDRRRHEFSQAKVHEGIVLHAHSKKILLSGGVDHYTTANLNARIDKIRDYSELAAPQARVFHPALVVLRAAYTFAKSYALQLGFLDGWRGLVIAWCAASGVFFKYIKAYINSAQAQARYHQWRRCKDRYLAECFRVGSEIAVHKSWHQTAVWMRKYYCAELISFLQNPDDWMARAEMVKDGRSTTVVHAQFGGGGGGVIIKRYNRKTIVRGLRYCLRTSKARIAWRNAHLLKISDIKTPAPIAFVEKRWGPFLLGSYFVCAFNQFPTAAQKYQHQPPNEQELSWLVALLEKMRYVRIYHGDLNAHNLLVTEQDIALIDLDQTQDFSAPIRSKIPGALRVFIHKHRKDRRRFLHDWRNKPAQLKCFTDVFEPRDKHHTTSAWPPMKKP